jgi:hypothetical protein
MVEQDFWDLLALDAPEEPENVQLVALLARLGASVIAGSATGVPMTLPARAAKTKGANSFVIVLWNLKFVEKIFQGRIYEVGRDLLCYFGSCSAMYSQFSMPSDRFIAGALVKIAYHPKLLVYPPMGSHTPVRLNFLLVVEA